MAQQKFSQPRCKKCGRLLTNPASIAEGVGPECGGAKSSHRTTLRQKVHKARVGRYEAFTAGAPVAFVNVTYKRGSDGLWRAKDGERGTSDEQFFKWMRRYGLVEIPVGESADQQAPVQSKPAVRKASHVQ